MTGTATLELREAMTNLYFKRALPTHNQILVALCARVPAVNAAANQLTEPVGMGYARVPILMNEANWSTAPDGGVFLDTTVSFPASTASWGYREGWALLSGSSTDGSYSPRVLATGRLLVPVKVASGTILRLKPGSISFTLTASG